MCAPGDIKPASINLHVLEGQLQGHLRRGRLDLQGYIQGGPYITENLYCICLSEHETCMDAAQIAVMYETLNSSCLLLFRQESEAPKYIYSAESSIFSAQFSLSFAQGYACLNP